MRGLLSVTMTKVKVNYRESHLTSHRMPISVPKTPVFKAMFLTLSAQLTNYHPEISPCFLYSAAPPP